MVYRHHCLFLVELARLIVPARRQSEVLISMVLAGVTHGWSRSLLLVPDHLLQAQLDFDYLVPVVLGQQSPLLPVE